MPSLSQLIVWIVVGLVGGTLAGLLIKWDRKEASASSETWAWASCGAFGAPACRCACSAFSPTRQVCDLVAGRRRRGRRVAAGPRGALALAALDEVALRGRLRVRLRPPPSGVKSARSVQFQGHRRHIYSGARKICPRGRDPNPGSSPGSCGMTCAAVEPILTQSVAATAASKQPQLIFPYPSDGSGSSGARTGRDDRNTAGRSTHKVRGSRNSDLTHA